MTGHAHEAVETIQVDLPDVERLDSRDFTLSYDEIADTMFVYFVAGEISPISVLVDPDNDVYALVDAESRDVVGIQLEDYLGHAVFAWPELVALGLWAGISPERLEPVLQDVAVQSSGPGSRSEAQRRFFDLSIKEQINRLLHAPDRPEAAATA